MFWIGAVVGLFIGFGFGILIICLAKASGQADAHLDYK